MAPAPALELDDLGLGEEENFMSVRSFLISWYCVEVAEASRTWVYVSCDRMRPSVGGGVGHPVEVAVKG